MSTISYPPTLSKEEMENLVFTIKDWSIAHGLAVRPPPSLISAEADPNTVLATTAPVTIFPSPFPKVCFEQATSIQKAYNELYAAIASDEDFLKEIVEEILEVDDFIAKLWSVHLKVKSEGYVQNLSLGLFRSDYMVHQDVTKPDSIPVVKQVEFNTIASSFGGLSHQTSQLHKYLATTGSYSDSCSDFINSAILPENTSTQTLALGLRAAYKAYLAQQPSTTNPSCIIFLVQSPERNIFDQRHLEYNLTSPSPPNSPIPVFRLPFSSILSHTEISGDDKSRTLLYHPPHASSKSYKVAVIYFRAGYDPSDYTSPKSWEARLHLERSNAIKCPSILTQLAGAKKVQQVLATPTSDSTSSILIRFLKPPSNQATIQQLQDTFTNIYPLDNSQSGLEARKIALDEEKSLNYVLKPQREGGGNNIYRAAIPPFLKSIPESHWKSYILMELITPPPVHNLILRNGNVEKGGVICELGVYGTCLWDGIKGEVLDNGEKTTGYLLRTKGDKSEEGGVAAGFGSMDSCVLV